MAQVRSMRAEDVQGGLALWNDNCKEAAQGLEPDEADRVSSNLRQYVRHDEAGCLVAEGADGLVGFVTFSLAGHPVMSGVTGEIAELYVRPEARRRGIGSELIRDATAELCGRGVSVVRALVCNDAERALRFWRGQGWENDMAVFTLYDGE